MLNRFVAAKKSLTHPSPSQQRRPHLSSLVTDVDEAERWRRHCLRDISRLLSAIQNGALGEAALRDLNDQINKLLREKGHWERQIKALGGPDYSAESARVKDADGRYALGTGGGRGRGGGGEYYYFGAAKELPGVRELFEKRASEEKKRSRAELSQAVDAEYYGLRDDEDGLLQRLERRAEKKMRAKAEREWREQHPEKAEENKVGDMQGEGGGGAVDLTGEEEEGEGQQRRLLSGQRSADDLLGLHVELPSTAEIEQQVLAKRKRVHRTHHSTPPSPPLPSPVLDLTLSPPADRSLRPRRSSWIVTATSPDANLAWPASE